MPGIHTGIFDGKLGKVVHVQVCRNPSRAEDFPFKNTFCCKTLLRDSSAASKSIAQSKQCLRVGPNLSNVCIITLCVSRDGGMVKDATPVSEIVSSIPAGCKTLKRESHKKAVQKGTAKKSRGKSTDR